jgi:glycosyltransferase involved in cell wall biosynthesis
MDAAIHGHRHIDMQRALHPRADLSSVASLTKIVREVRPDILHAHSSKAGAVARLARLVHPRLPVVYSPHLYAFAAYFERPAERHAYRMLERVLAPAASRVVCVCEDEARLARSIGPSSRVRTIHNGIGPAGDPPVDERLAELSATGPVLGAMTLLSRRKGLATLLDATPHVLAAHPQAQVAIIGEGPELAALREHAERLHVAHAVSFLGLSAEPLAALRAMDIFVHPSWAESFPYVILEAMSVARPIVASDVGGTGEAIVNGESGILVAPGDEKALAGALIGLLNDPDTRRRMGELALRRVSERFTIENMIDGVSGVYEELLDIRRTTAPPSREAEAA